MLWIALSYVLAMSAKRWVAVLMGTVFSYVLAGIWFCAVLIFLVSRTPPTSIVPTSLWSYSVAMSPIAIFVGRARHWPTFGLG